ncbi:MAG: hypothetical protein IPL84_04020 [Chitinophagaceae bacterium]|nr:hypothetical protein [Chitinophagaceae bacterium]
MEITELKNIEVSSKVLCEILGFKNSNYLSELVKDHGFIKSGHGKYPLLANIQRNFSYQEELHHAEIKKIREGNSRSRLDTVQAELKELELKEKQGELGKISEFKLALKNIVLLLKKGLDALETRLVFDMGLNPEQTETLKNNLAAIRNQIATTTPDTNAESVTF